MKQKTRADTNKQASKFCSQIKKITSEVIEENELKNGNTIKYANVVGNKSEDIVYVQFEGDPTVIQVGNPSNIPLFPRNQVAINITNGTLSNSRVKSRESSMMDTGWTFIDNESSDPFITLQTTYDMFDENMTPDLIPFLKARTILNVTGGDLVNTNVYGIIVGLGYTVSNNQTTLKLRILLETSSIANNAIRMIVSSDNIHYLRLFAPSQEPYSFPKERNSWEFNVYTLSGSEKIMSASTEEEYDSAFRGKIPQKFEFNDFSVSWNIILNGNVKHYRSPNDTVYSMEFGIDIRNISRNVSSGMLNLRYKSPVNAASGGILILPFHLYDKIEPFPYDETKEAIESHGVYILNLIAGTRAFMLENVKFLIQPDI